MQKKCDFCIMEILSNDTRTICFFSLNTDLEKTFICIQHYLYLKQRYPTKNAIILYDGLDNTYYRQIVFSKNQSYNVIAEALSSKQSINVEDYIEYDFILFDISQQNYNIYESFLYNSQLILVVNNNLTLHYKELELTRTVHKEIIDSQDGLKLFPVNYCNMVLNNFHFAAGNTQKQYNNLLEEVEDDNSAEISGILNLIENKDISKLTDDISYELLFKKIDAILFPPEEDEDDDELIYGDNYHTAK